MFETLRETRLQWELVKNHSAAGRLQRKRRQKCIWLFSFQIQAIRILRNFQEKEQKKNKNTVKGDGKSIEMACSFMCSDIWRFDEVLLADITSKAFI